MIQTFKRCPLWLEISKRNQFKQLRLQTLLSSESFLYINHEFRSDMVVRSIGNSLLVILPELIGKKITAWFDLVRPLIAFKFQTVSQLGIPN